MTTVPILLCFDERVLRGAGVTILSMLESAAPQTRYDIHIMHPGLSEGAQAGFQTLVDGTKHKVIFHQLSLERFQNVPTNRGSWREIIYFRLLASEILSDVERVIYSDVDVFVKRDLTEVFEMDLTDCEWGGVAAEAHKEPMVGHRYFSENSNDTVYFSGFMVMNLKLQRQTGAVQRYFDVIEAVGDRLKFFDLDVLNIATPKIARVPFDYVVLEEIYENADVTKAHDWGYLKSIYSAKELAHARDHAAIVHYAGPRGKPWQRLHNPAYYTDVEQRLPPELQRGTFRDWRKRWLSKRGRRAFKTDISR